MKGLILRITVVVMLLTAFSSFAIIKNNKTTEKPQQSVEIQYTQDFSNGFEEREIR